MSKVKQCYRQKLIHMTNVFRESVQNSAWNQMVTIEEKYDERALQ